MIEETEAQRLDDLTGQIQLKVAGMVWEPTPLMLGLKERGTSLEPLGGGDRNGCDSNTCRIRLLKD